MNTRFRIKVSVGQCIRVRVRIKVSVGQCIRVRVRIRVRARARPSQLYP